MPGYEKTIGTLLVGIVFNTFLYGLVMFQFAAYWRTKFNDPLPIKLMVLFLFLVDNVHSISVIYMLWEYCVTNFDNPAILTVALWPYTFTPIATALAAVVTQIFLGYRVYRLTKSAVLYGIILAIAIPACILGLVCGIRAWIIEVLVKLIVLNTLVTAWLALQVGTDLFITGTLTLVLLKSRTGFHKTDSVLYRLIRGAIQTGLFAGIFSLGDLATFLRYPDTNLYGMFAIPIGRIYTNTLLDTLLARDELRDKLSGTVEMDSTKPQDLSEVRWAAKPRTQGTTSSKTGSTTIELAEVEVRREVLVFNDDDTHTHPDDSSLKKGRPMDSDV
ncbi:hypothetical protein EUX98_g6204 [Antrodiella citrinella]|uniref:DUF6534 domain-containing protein n=1 Tax=Antrodiella citrinella TaxID=2447956 RepID=A0A4S4MPI9_9APHY|nr:hypothetical protein EUX98_g6204 [Antrodiella citrinella]